MAKIGKIRFKKHIKILFWIILLGGLILLIEANLRNRKVGEININIKNEADNYFLDTLEIERLLTNNHNNELDKLSYKNLSIKTLESRVKANLFVQDCEIARNLKGDLFVDVSLIRPVGRFIREGKPDLYIDSTGKIMPVVDSFTAKVLLITREKNQELPDFHKKDKNLLKLINYINQNKFLSAQIAQLDISKKREITMYLQVGKQIVEFGKCVNIRDKLKRLKIFYKEILPLKGWNVYKKINLKYNNQIICE